MPSKRRWLAITLILALAVMGLGLTASADSGMESQFLSKLNAERSSRGLAPLEVSGGLRTHARSHSSFMANGGCSGGASICHSSSSQLRAAAGSGWTKLGENVGRGPSVNSVHSALMGSSGHRANILGDYNYVGIGVAVKGDYIYVTQVFMKKGSTSSPSPTTTAPKKSSTPKKSTAAATTTTTTLPPTTTTTLVVPPDKEITPGNDCLQANRFWQMCHD